MSGDIEAHGDERSSCHIESNRANRRRRPSSKCLTGCCVCFGPWRRGFKIFNENLLVLSVIQFLCGVVAIVLSAVAISHMVHLYEMGAGMWSGAVMLITGGHGVVTSRRKTLCTLIALLVLCVLAAITSAILACVSVVGLAQDHNNGQVHVIVVHALLLIVGCLETSIAIATSVLCSKQICLFVITTDESGHAFVFAGGSDTLNGPGVRAELNTISEVLLRSVARRGQIPVVTGNGSSARASVLFVVPPRDPNEPVLVFPPFPPAYSQEEPRPLLPSTGSDSFLRPALVLAEDPPPYSAIDCGGGDSQRNRPLSLPSGESSSTILTTTTRSARVHLRSGRRQHLRSSSNRHAHSSPIDSQNCLDSLLSPPPNSLATSPAGHNAIT